MAAFAMIIIYVMPDFCFYYIYLNCKLKQKLKVFFFVSDITFNKTSVINLCPEINNIAFLQNLS